MPEKLSSPRTAIDEAATRKLAEFLRPYGAYTVCSADWYLQRPTQRNMDICSSWPTLDSTEDQSKDSWIFPIDGSVFDYQKMYPERLVCFSCEGTMEFATVGVLDDLINNELELCRKFVLAEVFEKLHINGNEVKMNALSNWIATSDGLNATLECVAHMRKEDTQIFGRQATNCVHLNSTTVEHIQLKEQTPHKLINQHPELSLQTTGTPCPMVIVNLEGTAPLENKGILKLTTVLMKASGLPLDKLQDYTIGQVISEFGLSHYGKGTHGTFKRMINRASTASCEIETWFSTYLRSLPKDAEITAFPTHEEYQRTVKDSHRTDRHAD